jgi:hypothetical protein
MPSADIITKIIELDSRADAITAKAMADARAVDSETQRLIEQEKISFEQKKKSRLEQVNKNAEEARKTQVEEVRSQYADLAQKTERVSEDKLNSSIESLFAKVKGIVS